MTTKNETFGSLLTAAISYIAACEHTTTAAVEAELGAALGVAGKTVQRYKSGVLPPTSPEQDRIRILAKHIVTRRVGSLGREWLERFLHAARYPAAAALLDELCPTHMPRPKPERVYQNLPAPTYDQFVMRQQAFADVVDGLSQRSAAVLIVGMGGTGKTSLAREVAAHCMQDAHDTPHFDAVVWVSDKDTPGTTNQSTVLDTIARTLDYPGFTQFPHDEKLYEVEQLLRRQQVLLIIDNAETITDGALFAWLLRLPEPSKALITTRERSRFLWSSWLVDLRGMNDDEARMLLHQRLERLRIAHMVHDPAQLEPLLVATGGNPKALTMVAGLLKYERRPLQQIIDDLYAARGALFDDLFSRAWSLLDAAGQRMVMVMTFFPDSASIDALSATAAVTGFDCDRAIERLTDLSLLDVQQADLTSAPRYVLHPLVRAFAKARLAEQPDVERAARERWMEWYIVLGERVGYCPNNLAQLTLLDCEYETLFVTMEWAYRTDRSPEVLRLCDGSMYYFYVRGFWDRWFLSNLFRLNIARTRHDTAEQIRAIAYQIQMLSRQGHLIQADQYYQELTTLTTQQHALDNESFFLVHHCLGAYYLARDNVDAARCEWQVLLDHKHRLSHYRRTATLQWIGLCLYYLDDNEQARSLFKLSLDAALHYNYGRYILFNRIRLAAIAIDEGELVQADAELTASEHHARFYRDREQLAYTLGLRSRLYVRHGSLELAKETLTEAIDIFERLGIRREVAEAREELARLDAQMALAVE